MTSDVPLSTSTVVSTLADGDKAAGDGRWADAVSIWAGMRGGPASGAAEQRLRWFLDQTGQQPHIERKTGRSDWLLIMMAAVLGCLGTAIVLLGDGQTDVAAVIASVAAWTCYLSAGVLTVMYAYAGYRAERDRTRLDDATVTTAMAMAQTLDDAAGPGRS